MSIPPVGCADAVTIVKEFYGLNVVECSSLRSYADRNFLVTAVADTHRGEEAVIRRYVLKILNKRDSKAVQYINAQNDYLIHLKTNGVTCPEPYHTLDGKLSMSKELPENSDNGDIYNIRLFTYIPGKDLYDIERQPSAGLLRQVGELLGNICNANEVFDHPGYKENKSIFVPERLPSLRQYIPNIPDEQDQLLVTKVMDEYMEVVVPRLANFKECPIHGDISPSNIVITADNQIIEVAGIIDVFDTMKSHIVFELGICLGMMFKRFSKSTEDFLQIAAHILDGFLSVRRISDFEKNLVKICTEACLARLVVCGAYFLALAMGDDEIIKRSIDTVTLRKLREISSDRFEDMIEEKIRARSH